MQQQRLVCTNRHWKVRMVVVVVEHIADSLVQHGEKARQRSQLGVVHYMLQSLSMFQALRYDCICSKVRLQNDCALPLNLPTNITWLG